MMVVRLEDWREDPERRDLSGVRATKSEGGQFPGSLHGPLFSVDNPELRYMTGSQFRGLEGGPRKQHLPRGPQWPQSHGNRRRSVSSLFGV